MNIDITELMNVIWEGVVQYFNRIDGEFVKAEPPYKPGKIVRVKHTNETWNDDRGEKVGDELRKGV